MRILVLGDYLPANTIQQMETLTKAAKSLPESAVITVKPHPACPVDPRDYPDLKVSISMEPVEKLLNNCDVAFASSMTSAAVDAYCTGLPVVVLRDPETLNYSPLRNFAGVFFACTSEELANYLNEALKLPVQMHDRGAFFTIDKNLPRWRSLLKKIELVEN